MKKLIAALAVAGVGLLAGGSAVDAYPPGSGTVTVDDATPDAGGTFTVTVDNCTPSESVSFAFEGQTPVAACSAGGVASAALTAPTAAGTYNGSATFSGTTINFAVNVLAPTPTTGALPATGSSSTGSTMMIATVLLLAGAGMFAVAQVRRRQTLTA